MLRAPCLVCYECYGKDLKCKGSDYLHGSRTNVYAVSPITYSLQVTDVSEARDATGRNNSLLLSTPTGRVLYVADSETEQVEWVSALEGSLAKIMKQARWPSMLCLLCALGLCLIMCRLLLTCARWLVVVKPQC